MEAESDYREFSSGEEDKDLVSEMFYCPTIGTGNTHYWNSVGSSWRIIEFSSIRKSSDISIFVILVSSSGPGR